MTGEVAPASSAAITALAAHLVALARSGDARVVAGVIAAGIDAQHVLVDLGDQAITAAWPASLGTPADGISVRVLVSGGIAEVISTKQAPPVPPTIKHIDGTATLNFSGSSTASVAVSYSSAGFVSNPKVLATLQTQGLGIVVAVTSRTTTGCTIRGATGGAATYTGAVDVGWYAVDPD